MTTTGGKEGGTGGVTRPVDSNCHGPLPRVFRPIGVPLHGSYYAMVASLGITKSSSDCSLYMTLVPGRMLGGNIESRGVWPFLFRDFTFEGRF